MNSGKTILLVDDDAAIVELMRDFLEDEGFSVEEAFNANEALSILQQVNIDCILLDIKMPGQSGFKLCRQIRRTNETPILFFSANGDDVDKIRGLSLGGDDYIVKSVTPEEVVARIKAVLRRISGKVMEHKYLLDFGHLVLDLKAHEASMGGKQIALTPKEFSILCLFSAADNPDLWRQTQWQSQLQQEPQRIANSTV